MRRRDFFKHAAVAPLVLLPKPTDASLKHLEDQPMKVFNIRTDMRPFPSEIVSMSAMDGYLVVATKWDGLYFIDHPDR